MKNPNISRFGLIEGRMHRDPDTGMLNVDWEDGHREVYMTLSALRAAGIKIADNSKYSKPERRYTRRGNILHLRPFRQKPASYGRKIQ